MRKAFADNHAKLSKPDAKELGARNRESGLQGIVQIYNEQLDTDTVPSGAAWIEPGDSVPQVITKDQEGIIHHIPFGAGIPIGGMIVWPGTSDPAGGEWFICDGRTLSTSVYADLFAVCGTTWNTGGEPPGTFRIPDMRSRTPVGAGQGTGLTNRALGSTFGAENHTLGITEIPAHSHTASGGSHSHTASTNSPGHSHGGSTSGGGHEHLYSNSSGSFQAANGTFGSGAQAAVTTFNTSGGGAHSHGVSTDSQSHSHTVTVNSFDATPTIANTGGGSSHNNMQPSIGINFILRVL